MPHWLAARAARRVAWKAARREAVSAFERATSRKVSAEGIRGILPDRADSIGDLPL